MAKVTGANDETLSSKGVTSPPRTKDGLLDLTGVLNETGYRSPSTLPHEQDSDREFSYKYQTDERERGDHTTSSEATLVGCGRLSVCGNLSVGLSRF